MITKAAASIRRDVDTNDFVTHKELQDEIVHGATGGLLGYGLGGLPGAYMLKKYPRVGPLVAVAGATLGDIAGTTAAVKLRGLFRKKNKEQE